MQWEEKESKCSGLLLSINNPFKAEKNINIFNHQQKEFLHFWLKVHFSCRLWCILYTYCKYDLIRYSTSLHLSECFSDQVNIHQWEAGGTITVRVNVVLEKGRLNSLDLRLHDIFHIVWYHWPIVHNLKVFNIDFRKGRHSGRELMFIELQQWWETSLISDSDGQKTRPIWIAKQIYDVGRISKVWNISMQVSFHCMGS